MENFDLKKRTFQFSSDIIDLVELLPKTKATSVISYQLLKSGTSVGANYRAALRGRSNREFVSKINIVLEEADESLFWLELITEKKWVNDKLLPQLRKEADELTSIFVKTLKTMKGKKS